jgi:hypothetical protein
MGLALREHDLRSTIPTPALEARRKFLRFFRGGFYDRFERWLQVVEALARIQSGVPTRPVAMVFGFIALPNQHIYVKPKVTRKAAREYGFDFECQSRPSWNTYAGVLEFADILRRDLADLRPHGMIDIQSSFGYWDRKNTKKMNGLRI